MGSEWAGAAADASEPRLGTAVWRFRGQVLVAAVVGGLLAMLTTVAINGDSVASSTVALTSPGPGNVVLQGGSTDAALARYTEQRAEFMVSDTVLGQAAASLGDPRSPSVLRRSVTAVPDTGSNSVRIEVAAEDEPTAVALAAAVVEAYRSGTRQQAAVRTGEARGALEDNAEQIIRAAGDTPAQGIERAAAAEALSALQQRAALLEVERTLFDDGVEFVVEATTDDVESPGVPLREGAIGLLLGGVLGVVLAWFRADRDRRLETPGQVDALLDAPLLGEVEPPRYQSSLDDVDILPAVPYRAMMPSVLARTPPGVLFVTSSEDDGSRGQLALNLAVAASRDGRTVALVDADLERARLTAALGGGGAIGVSDVLAQSAQVADLQVMGLPVTTGAGVRFLPAGRYESAAFGVPALAVEQLLIWLRGQVDLVVVDGASPVADPLSAQMVRLADRVLLVVYEGSVESGLTRLTRLLRLDDARVVGWVLLRRGLGAERRIGPLRARRRIASRQVRASALRHPRGSFT